MSTNTKTGIQKAVLVAIQLPKMESAEVQSSLQELSRLVTTLGYQVIGQISQKRGSTKSAQLLGDGKLQELARWTGGTGKIASLVDRKKSKAALKWEAQSDVEDEIDHFYGEDGTLIKPEIDDDDFV